MWPLWVVLNSATSSVSQTQKWLCELPFSLTWISMKLSCWVLQNERTRSLVGLIFCVFLSLNYSYWASSLTESSFDFFNITVWSKRKVSIVCNKSGKYFKESRKTVTFNIKALEYFVYVVSCSCVETYYTNKNIFLTQSLSSRTGWLEQYNIFIFGNRNDL